jgi:hypothetical protein
MSREEGEQRCCLSTHRQVLHMVANTIKHWNHNQVTSLLALQLSTCILQLSICSVGMTALHPCIHSKHPGFQVQDTEAIIPSTWNPA